MVITYNKPTKEERQIASYAGTMRARDQRWAQSPHYSQNALLAAHLQRIGELTRDCPPIEIKALTALQGFIEDRLDSIAKRLSPDAD